MKFLAQLVFMVLLFGLLTVRAADKNTEYPIGWPALERLELLPLLPVNGTQTKQFVSYDTSGGNAWGFRHFRRYEQDGEWVFFDEFGPGCLYRLQMNVFRHLTHPADQAHIRFRFDDETEPRIDMTFAEFFGKNHQYVAPFTPPLAYFDMIGTEHTKGGGFANLYYPFTFRKRLRVSAWHPQELQGWKDTWYQFTYLKYPSGTEVETWAGRDSDSPTVRTQWEKLGDDPKRPTGGQPITKSVSLAPGASAVLVDEQGTGSLTKFLVQMKPWNATTFSKVRLRMTWDDQAKPMVDVPIGCLFGGGGETLGKQVADKSLKTLLFGYDGTAGTGYSYWPMPFWKRARIEVVNDSATEIESLQFTTERAGPGAPAYPQNKAGYFAVTRTLDVSAPEAYYSRAFRHRGHGKVVGLMMYSTGFSMDGDEFTYFDGSKTPQIHGDGTEDDHNQGWGGYAIQKPLWGGLINGYDGAYRLYLAEPYVFQNEISITYEHSNWGGAQSGQKTDFIVWSYLGSPDMGNLTQTDQIEIGDPELEKARQVKVVGQTWAGQTTASHDKYEQGDPFPTTDVGVAFSNHLEFVANIDPGNEGVRLRRRLNRHLANVQMAKVFVDGAELKDTPWYFCDLPTSKETAFAEQDFEIPATYTRGKKQLTIRLEHVRAEPANANNAYRFNVYCYGLKKLPPAPPEPASPPHTLSASVAPEGKVTLSWQPGQENPATAFVLQRRTAGQAAFGPLATVKGDSTTFIDQTVKAFESCWYRIRAEGVGGPSAWIAYEQPVVYLPGPDCLKEAKVTASSQWDATHAPDKTTDGDLKSRWNSAPEAVNDQWLAFELPKPKRLAVVVVHQETQWARIADYKLQARVDREWKDLYIGKDMPDVAVCRFAPVLTDCLRIWITKTERNTPTIKEVKAFEDQSQHSLPQ